MRGAIHRGASAFLPTGVALLTLLLAASASAQGISGASTSTAGSTANDGDTSGSTRSSVAIQTNTSSTFATRFAWNVSADVGAASTRDQAGNAQHNLSFNVTAPGGYRLDVDQSRVGIIQRNSDVSTATAPPTRAGSAAARRARARSAARSASAIRGRSETAAAIRACRSANRRRPISSPSATAPPTRIR